MNLVVLLFYLGLTFVVDVLVVTADVGGRELLLGRKELEQLGLVKITRGWIFEIVSWQKQSKPVNTVSLVDEFKSNVLRE